MDNKDLTGLSESSFDRIYLGDIASIYPDIPYYINLPSTQGTNGQVLTTSGVKATYWTSITDVIGVLPVANGGTGVSLSTGTTRVVLSNSPTITTPTITNPTIGGLVGITTPLPTYTYLLALSTGDASYIAPSIAGDLIIRPLDFSAATFISGAADASNYVQLCKPGAPSIKVVKDSPRLALQRPSGALAQFAIASGSADVFPNTLVNDLCIQADSSIRLRSNDADIIMQNPVYFYNDQYSYKLKVTCETSAGGTFPLTSIGDAVLKSDKSMYLGSPGNQFHIWGEGVYFNGTRTNIGNTLNGVGRFVTINSGLNDWATVTSNVVTFYGVPKDAGSWGVGQVIRARLYPEEGDYYIVDTTITTSTLNSPSPGLTKITFPTYLSTPNGNYICKAVPSQVNGESGYVAGSIINYTARVAAGTWTVGTLVTGIIDNYAATIPTRFSHNFLCEILSVTEGPSGMYTITFPCEYDGTPFTVPSGDYHVAILPYTSALTWYAFSNINFDLFEEDLSFKRGLGLSYSLGNYGRFVNAYSYPVIVQIQYEAAKSIFNLPLVPPIPFAGDTFNQFSGYVNTALTVINGQTSMWIEANNDGISLAPVTVASTGIASGSATTVLDPGEYIQLRGFNNAPINGGIWDGSRLTFTVTRLQ